MAGRVVYRCGWKVLVGGCGWRCGRGCRWGVGVDVWVWVWEEQRRGVAGEAPVAHTFSKGFSASKMNPSNLSK